MTHGAPMPKRPGDCYENRAHIMSTDYREKEREFLDGLKEDTGRDVREWMAAISQQKLPHRNDIIDWLRQQGFMFSKASWLERVHHNGGKPIYSDAALPRRAMPKRAPATGAALPALLPETLPPSPAVPPDPAAPSVAAPPVPVASAAAQSVAAPPDALDALLATAKAYRPLAVYLLREIAKTIPGTTPAANGTYVSLMRDGKEFAALAMGAKELRLGLTLENHPVEAPLQAARFPNPAVRVTPAITHMALLNDVRQIDSALMDWIVKAAGRTAAAA